jgi:hypothetical protein
MHDPLSGGPSLASIQSNQSKRSTNSKRKKKHHKVSSDLLLGPKRGWTEQSNLVMTRRFHDEMLRKATSYIGKELDAHEHRLKTAAKLFDQSSAQENARKFAQKKTSAENKRLLKRLLKVEMQETEITKTNAPGCAEKVRFRRQRKARKKALKASKQHKLDRINRENGMMLARLQKARGSLSSKTWSDDFARHKKQGRLMSKMRHVQKKKKKKTRQQQQQQSSSVNESISLPSLGSSNEHERQRRRRHQGGTSELQHNQQQQYYHQQQQQQQQQQFQHNSIGRESNSSSTSSLPPLSPETTLRTMNQRVASEKERQRLLGVFSSLSISDLSKRLERFANLLSPQLSMDGFKQMIKDLPKAVLVRTLADVVRQAPQYGQQQQNNI